MDKIGSLVRLYKISANPETLTICIAAPAAGISSVVAPYAAAAARQKNPRLRRRGVFLALSTCQESKYSNPAEKKTNAASRFKAKNAVLENKSCQSILYYCTFASLVNISSFDNTPATTSWTVPWESIT